MSTQAQPRQAVDPNAQKQKIEFPELMKAVFTDGDVREHALKTAKHAVIGLSKAAGFAIVTASAISLEATFNVLKMAAGAGMIPMLMAGGKSTWESYEKTIQEGKLTAVSFREMQQRAAQQKQA